MVPLRPHRAHDVTHASFVSFPGPTHITAAASSSSKLLITPSIEAALLLLIMTDPPAAVFPVPNVTLVGELWYTIFEIVKKDDLHGRMHPILAVRLVCKAWKVGGTVSRESYGVLETCVEMFAWHLISGSLNGRCSVKVRNQVTNKAGRSGGTIESILLQSSVG
ncbi:hypothetical protein CALVIDRAFT_202914 [Calocera viscosa TUFC12733]|uniref:Uncharacterized protein n=1 Tax=Calocera viscosa (strain TUFC12733) TaxID=1330018 RepID=A0A167KBM5_CALVF|nr:hypothetical protein CALVIDRAFT_202914 [Calocera viscosa TUFC12733]